MNSGVFKNSTSTLFTLLILTRKGKPLTLKEMYRGFENKLGAGKLLHNAEQYQKEDFYKKQTPRIGWRFVSRDVIPGSCGKNYVEQMQLIADYGTNCFFKGRKPSKKWQDAVDEWNAQKAELEKLLQEDWQACAARLATLKLNEFRERPVEVVYHNILQFYINGTYTLPKVWVWTNTQSSNGPFVCVGGCYSPGVRVSRGSPGDRGDYLGVRFSCSAEDLVS